MESQVVFERNLARFRRRHRSFAQDLEEADLSELDIGEGPRGATTVSCDGVLLASAYNPEEEGRRIADEICQEPGDVLVAIGFGMGHHLDAYLQRHPTPLIVYEPSLACLRAALSARAIPWLGHEDVFFAKDPDDLALLVQNLYATGTRLKVHPHPPCVRLHREQVHRAVANVTQAKRIVDVRTNTRVQKLQPWAEKTVDNARHLLRSPSFHRLYRAFRGIPAVVVAAGPSLDKQLDLLARERHRLLVIAIGQSLGTLHSAGIEPDLVHAVEMENVTHQFTDTGDPKSLSLVLLPSVHSGLFEIPYRERFIAYPGANPVGAWIAEGLGDERYFLGGATVAQSAVHLAAFAGAETILLIGQDLAYTNGRVYSGKSAYGFMGLQRQGDGKYVLTHADEKQRMLGNVHPAKNSEEREIVMVPGWDGEPVATSNSYASFIEGYREIGRNLKAFGVRLVNCTEGGARIPMIEHMRFEDALQECPSEVAPVREVIRRAHQSGGNVTPAAFEEPLHVVHSLLDQVERLARAGFKRSERASAALRIAHAPARKLQILKGISRAEEKMKHRLDEVPWLDTFVQPLLHRVLAETRKAENRIPDPEQAASESRVMFEAVIDGVDRARILFDRFALEISRDHPPIAPVKSAAIPPDESKGHFGAGGPVSPGQDS